MLLSLILITIIEVVIIVFSIVSYIYRYQNKTFEFIHKTKISLLCQMLIPFLGIALWNIIAIYNDNGVVLSDYFASFAYTLKLYSFEMNNDSLKTLINNNSLYGILFVLSYLPFIFGFYFSIIATLFERWINSNRNKYRLKKALKGNCDILIGLKDIDYYINEYVESNSCDYNIIVWSNEIDKEIEKKLLLKGIPYIKDEFNSLKLSKINFNLEDKSMINFISFNEETVNMKYISEFINFISKDYGNIKFYQTEKFNLHIEIGLDNIVTITNKILAYRENESVTISPFIHCFNRYELNAQLFEEQNPITRFLPENFINKEKAAIINETDKKVDDIVLNIGEKVVVKSNYSKMINVVYLGYGKVSKQLFKISSMNNQIPSLEVKGNKQVLKNHIINYFAFDFKTLKEGDKNNIYYQLRMAANPDFKEDKNYFAPPEYTHKFYPCDYNVYGESIINSLVNIAGYDDNKYTSIVVSLENDLDNIDYALKVNLLFQQMGIKNYHIFVRVQDEKEEFVKYLNDHFTFFGNFTNVLNHNVIINDELNKVAHILDSTYNAKKLSKESWFSKDSIKHKSSVYAALNLRLKLNLLGIDYVKKDEINEEDKKVSIDELEALLPQIKLDEEGNLLPRKYEDFTFFNTNKEITSFNSLGFQEKLRWNSFYIFNGYVQMSYDDMCVLENGSIYKDDNKTKKHACITTYEGLDEYHRLYAKLEYQKVYNLDSFPKKLNKEEKEKYDEILEQVQTYKYDYNLVDNFRHLFFELDEYVLIYLR